MPAHPTPQQLAWADAEVGVIIHLDLQVFEPAYAFRDWGVQPQPSVFAPTDLDTDQWLETAAAAGARYAVLVAKHCSGFSLWPTAAHDYSVRSSPWRNGQGDVVADFVASCQRFGIRPGIYYSTSCNAFCDVDNPGLVRSGSATAQAAYNRLVALQLQELWTCYGQWFEIWFDGGVLGVAEGGCDVSGMLAQHQPEAVLFQGPESRGNLLRWTGNELGWAAPDCWSASDVLSCDDGVASREDLAGNPDGRHWAPVEVDMPNRQPDQAFMGGWFWRAGEDGLVIPAETLFARHLTSVGRNANFLIGMAIDRAGRVPAADAAALRGYGDLVRRRIGTPCAQVDGRPGNRLELALPATTELGFVGIMEDQTDEQAIRGWRLDAQCNGQWVMLASGASIGHLRLVSTPALRADALRFVVTAAAGTPRLRRLAAYPAG